MPKPSSPTRKAKLGSALVALGILLGCGPANPEPWLFERAALLRCGESQLAVAEKSSLDSLPSVRVPENFFMRQMDPLGVAELGIRHGQVACLALKAPAEEEVESAIEGMRWLRKARTRAGKEFDRAFGDCACVRARASGLQGFLPGCSTAVRHECGNSESEEERSSKMLARWRDELSKAPIVWQHWRFVGPTDKSNWVRSNATALARRSTESSRLFLPDQKVEVSMGPRALLKALIRRKGTELVALQDRGASLLVVREARGLRVMDLFVLPRLGGVEEAYPLVWESLRERIFAALGKPDRAGALPYAREAGPQLYMDFEALRDLDRSFELAGKGAGSFSRFRQESPDGQRGWAASLALQAPWQSRRDHEGVHEGGSESWLRGRLELGFAGQERLAPMVEQPFYEVGESILEGAQERPPRENPGIDPGWLLRYQDAGQLAGGMHSAWGYLLALESMAGGTVMGSLSSLTAKVDPMIIPEGFEPDGSAFERFAAAWREHRAQSPGELSLELESRGGAFIFELD